MALSITTRGGVRIQGTAEDLGGLVDLLRTALDCGHGFAAEEAQVVLLGDDGKPLLPRRPGAKAEAEAAGVKATATRSLQPAPEPEMEVEQAPRIAPLSKTSR